MTAPFSIQKTMPNDTRDVAIMVGELLLEIMNTIGVRVFHFDLDESTVRLKNFIEQEKYFVFAAKAGNGKPVGFIALYESYALYAEGVFGTIPELFVRPQFRSQNIGQQLLNQAKMFGNSRGWRRLEVTTPPLPQFDKTLAFYQKEGLAITGGRKLKVDL